MVYMPKRASKYPVILKLLAAEATQTAPIMNAPPVPTRTIVMKSHSVNISQKWDARCFILLVFLALFMCCFQIRVIFEGRPRHIRRGANLPLLDIKAHLRQIRSFFLLDVLETID